MLVYFYGSLDWEIIGLLGLCNFQFIEITRLCNDNISLLYGLVTNAMADI